MSECTNIADFRGIREMKPRIVYTAPQSAKTSYGFMVLDSATAYRERAVEQHDEPVALESQPVYDIGMVRDSQRFGHRNTSSITRGSKVIRFSNAMPRRSTECRGVATWNASCEDPLDCPPAA
jgi:hypothetical protein